MALPEFETCPQCSVKKFVDADDGFYVRRRGDREYIRRPCKSCINENKRRRYAEQKQASGKPVPPAMDDTAPRHDTAPPAGDMDALFAQLKAGNLDLAQPLKTAAEAQDRWLMSQARRLELWRDAQEVAPVSWHEDILHKVAREVDLAFREEYFERKLEIGFRPDAAVDAIERRLKGILRTWYMDMPEWGRRHADQIVGEVQTQ